MSLDVYLEPAGLDDVDLVEIKRAVEFAYGPEKAGALLDALEWSLHPGERFSANITHNLGGMAAEAGIYEACWRPFLLVLTPEQRQAYERARTAEPRDWDTEYEIEEKADVRARHLIPRLREGLALMKADPARFQKHNPENGWGDYGGFVLWVERYLAACVAAPNAKVMASR